MLNLMYAADSVGPPYSAKEDSAAAVVYDVECIIIATRMHMPVLTASSLGQFAEPSPASPT